MQHRTNKKRQTSASDSQTGSTDPSLTGYPKPHRPLTQRPAQQGMYFPSAERDSCGVGFVCHIKGEASRQIMDDAQSINCCMDHRGGVGYEANTGDGAGILTALPEAFLSRVAKESPGINLPPVDHYGCGIVFLPRDQAERAHCKAQVEGIIAAKGLACLGWRALPTDLEAADLGEAAKACMPKMEMLFIGAGESNLSGDALERKLYLVRKKSSHELRGDTSLNQRQAFYICSLSTKTIVYKGMLTPAQLFPFFPDLGAADYQSHIAMVHSRFSTNTFPSWDRAQPNRFMSHNGEINTILGNINWMNAREGTLKSDVFGDELAELFPIVEVDCSDSGTFDNVLEFLMMGGRRLHEAIVMMIPEAWQSHDQMPAEKRDYYEYHSCLMEPWDGPASVTFTDGHFMGAVLDRNGLRPSRYYITHDDRCIMASEVGVLNVDPANIKIKGRLQPGRMFLIDFEQGRMLADTELKAEMAGRQPYGQWLAEQRLDLADIAAAPDAVPPVPDEKTVLAQMRAFGYTQETMQFMLIPLIQEQRDPLSSMGNDASLAVLSELPRMIYDYFKQRFAQITNPAIDSIREGLIMSLESYIGPEANLLETTPAHANRLRILHPILTNEELAALKQVDQFGWRARTLDMTFDHDEGAEGLDKALTALCEQTHQAIQEGYKLVILSDRGLSAERVPISALVAVGAVHQYLVKHHARTQIGLIVETGEAREVHHHCLLIGYGADAINPYLAFTVLWHEHRLGHFTDCAHITSDADIVAAYRKGVAKGILKVMGKMGISTLQSYRGAQIFEAVGLNEDLIERCFKGTTSRVRGVDLAVHTEEIFQRHALGFPKRSQIIQRLPNPGEVHWRQDGERHMWNPSSVAKLQDAVRQGEYESWERFSEYSNERAVRACTLRGLLQFKETRQAIALEEVESEATIMQRFATGAMSFGSISKEAHETLAIAMNRINAKSNTGEGGEQEERYLPMPNGDSKCSAIKQVASGRFGVTINYLSNAEELQIKIVQGAKPGEGGELPGDKVDDVIAAVRHSTPLVGLISPPPHHDVYSIEDIAQLIYDLKNANPSARISVKLGAEGGVGAVAAGVVKAKSDHLVIAGHDGGTGASALTSIKHAGLPWEIGIAEVHHTLVLNNLRSRVVLQTDGQLKTGRDVAIACLLGAEEFGFATAPLIAMGCIMMRKCHLNTCPVGIATQNPVLRKKFTGQPEQIVNYFYMVAKELRQIMAQLGLRTVNEMVGRADLLDAKDASDHWKAKGVDLAALIERSAEPADCLGTYAKDAQNHHLDRALDHQLIARAEPALAQQKPVRIEMPISNTNRTVGAMLSHEIIKRVGPQMLPDESIHIKLNGSAGQSLGAWLAAGVTLEVEGDANDYIGKGLSGGRLVIYPPKASTFVAEENIIVGNVGLYGATSGEVFIRGVAAERFCVRNSGAIAVIEGLGDHGCEYMTGGRVVVLGDTGRNFAAGMSGGIAYIYDPNRRFAGQCNQEMVGLGGLEPEDSRLVQALLEKHYSFTGSQVAETILSNWQMHVEYFVKVLPTDYKRALAQQARAAQQPLSSAQQNAVLAG